MGSHAFAPSSSLEYLRYDCVNNTASNTGSNTANDGDSPQDTYGPPMGRRLVVFVDDMNMPRVDKYGTQQPIALMRTTMERRGLFDRRAALPSLHSPPSLALSAMLWQCTTSTPPLLHFCLSPSKVPCSYTVNRIRACMHEWGSIETHAMRFWGASRRRGKELNWKHLRDVQYCAAMGPPGGARNPTDPRFISLFCAFEITSPATEALQARVK